jgi:hypothetical protein
MVFEAEIALSGNLDTGNQSQPLVSWTVEGKELTSDRFERFTLLALEHLIDRSHEELD